MNLPEGYVGLGDVDRASLIEHAEQVQRNFRALTLAMPTPGSFPVLPSSQAQRLLAGRVSATGTIAGAGTGGWTVARTGGAPVGDYTITFDTAFSGTNIVPDFTPVAAVTVPVFIAVSTTTVRYQTVNLAGALADCAVAFLLLGEV